MNAARIALLAVACSLPLAASAQWQWVDNTGRKVFSDQPPPADVPPERILRKPGPRGQAFSVPAPVPAAAPAAASLPRPSGKDSALEEKRKQAEAAEAQKRKEEDEKIAAARAENCSRAKTSKATYESGLRISRVNDKGEREILDDNQRATELKHLNDVIARDCK